ncbi:hypothetical protein GXP67_08240 [Rhodocytophaga rosea]|uniref:Uncharacterized protein n=1 Tax=Rhodocytophaga rosea TaxID=2704465 RepID=A0A6C0GFA2_9BACT|nr:hypothetical protein [Rhodocytophaga rosea]QHT66646.1 hypothetical protein GXP67_08240 [Rhodocytophaga rosea]
MLTDYRKMLEELEARDQVILHRMNELERQNRVLKEVNLNLRHKCVSQKVNNKLMFSQKD